MRRTAPLRRSCGKRRYPDEATATRALRVAQADPDTARRKPVRVYRHGICGGWHLTVDAAHKPVAGRRRAAKRRAGDPSAKTRGLVLDRAGFACELCGRSLAGGAWSLHHRTPRGAGGTSDPASASPCNLVVLCGTGTTGCHGWVESHRALASAAGWIVPSWADPAARPIYHHHHRGPLLLTPDGGYAPMPRPGDPGATTEGGAVLVPPGGGAVTTGVLIPRPLLRRAISEASLLGGYAEVPRPGDPGHAEPGDGRVTT